MKIIDAHMHFSNIKRFKNTAQEISNVDYSAEGLKNEYKETEVSEVIAMGVTETKQKSFPDSKAQTPMQIDLAKERPAFMTYCIGINPYQLAQHNIKKIESQLQKNSVKGIKLYPGYYPFNIYDNRYTPVYNLAEKYDTPVVIHGGSTYSSRGQLKYSHPLNVNQLAAKFKNITFVIAHLGDPWIIDAITVIDNSDNVYADLSGLIVGDSTKIKERKEEKLFIDHLKEGIIYNDCYDKLLFGSDWPLVQIKPYIKFIKHIIPSKQHDKVFYKNAQKVFNFSTTSIF